MTRAIRIPCGRLVTPGAYTRAWRAVKAAPADRTTVHGWSHFPEPASAVLADFRAGLMDRINQRGGVRIPARAADLEWPWRRDQRRLQDIRHRIRVYEFETPACRARFGHLLANRGD